MEKVFKMKKIGRLLPALMSMAQILFLPTALAANPAKYFTGESLVLTKAIRAGENKAIKSLSENLDLNQVYDKDMTVLAYAMLVKNTDAITELVLAGADPLQYTEGMGQPLVLAAQGKTEFLKAFLRAGVDPNSRDRWGMPILFAALDWNSDDKIKLLIEYGADLEIRSSNVKRGALDQAFSGLYYDRVVFLIKQGLSNFLVEDTNGVTFAYTLQTELDHQSKDQTTLAYKKLVELKSLLEERGVKFPVEPSDKLRARLEKTGK